MYAAMWLDRIKLLNLQVKMIKARDIIYGSP